MQKSHADIIMYLFCLNENNRGKSIAIYIDASMNRATPNHNALRSFRCERAGETYVFHRDARLVGQVLGEDALWQDEERVRRLRGSHLVRPVRRTQHCRVLLPPPQRQPDEHGRNHTQTEQLLSVVIKDFE